MKRLEILFWACLVAVFLAACGGESTTEETSDLPEVDETEEPSNDIADEDLALSIWEGHSVRTGMGAGGEWVATVTFGEKLELLGETGTDEKSKKEYTKVRLLDGKEGWVRSDMIHQGGTLAAITEEAQVYSRPGISNIKDEMLAPATLVVLIGKSEEFVEYTARNNGSNRSKGWLLGDQSYTTDQDDIAVAIMLSKAMAEKVPAKKQEKLQAIANNSKYAESPFIRIVNEELKSAEVAEELSDDQLMITGDNVNVRSEPKLGENKLFQLSSGVVCTILERGLMEEVGGKSDYWYRVSADGKSGWVFGTFTSKAL